jgi:sugar lactone lactonase YvrE
MLNLTTSTQVDAVGNVYICDSNNHRIVRFPAGTDVADRVWGKPTLEAAGPATAPPTPASLNVPQYTAPYDGGLFVCDSGNNRLLFYASLTATAASNVWGPPDFTTSAAAVPPTASSLSSPNGVVFNRAGTMMFVTDGGTTNWNVQP